MMCSSVWCWCPCEWRATRPSCTAAECHLSFWDYLGNRLSHTCHLLPMENWSLQLERVQSTAGSSAVYCRNECGVRFLQSLFSGGGL